MSQPLRVLIVEDSESDAALVVRLLGKAGYDVHDERVENAGQMQAALARQAWDVIIADYRLPEFDAPAALALLQGTGLDIPFIVVSGTIGEDTAVAMMKAGAHDYLMKDKLLRLAPAVEREIREAQTRRERRRVEEALRQSEARYRLIAEHVNDIIWQLDKELRFVYTSPVVEHILGYSVEETHQLSVTSLLDAEGIALMRQVIQTRLTGSQQEAITPTEYKMRHKDGRWIDVEIVSSAIFDPEGQLLGFAGVTRDITGRKQVETKMKQQLEELQRWYDLTLDRETRSLELKREVNELLRRLNEPIRYPGAEA